MKNPFILSAVRTPIGAFLGNLSSLKAPELGRIVAEEAIKRAGINKEEVQQVIMGNVLTAGEGQAPARQVAMGAGLRKDTGALTINKVCGSGLMSVVLASRAVALGDAEVVLAGGMESMSNTPYLLERARTGYRMGNSEIVDSMIKDGLLDVYKQIHMGECAELCAKKYNFSRQEQDEFSIKSYEKALKAQKEGFFRDEIIPVEVQQKKETVRVEIDEEPGRADLKKISSLKPAFIKDGTITAGNASKINDGASAVIVVSEEYAKMKGIKPLAKILSYATHGEEPEWFTIAPVGAIKKAVEKAGLKLQDIDLFEINEAFAVVTMAAIRELKIPPEKVNVHGGAVALGHPIGASGTRILTTLLYAMQRRGLRYGLASLCIGGGEAIAMVVERV
jgi:acetyl-CoA C-acetyltransferase